MSSKTSSELDGMIYGMLLGDGCIRKPTKAGTCNFVLHHSAKQKEYFFSKLALLEEVSHVKTNYWEKSHFSKKNQKTYYSIYGQSNFLNYFKKLRDVFYNSEGTKIVTETILKKLTPLGLALWWMDDGCLYVKRHKNSTIERRAFLSTCSFTEEEHVLIKQYFFSRWNLNVTIRQHPKTKYRYISFPVEDFKKFVEIIKEHVVPSMQYKIDYNKELNLKTGPKPRVGE